MATERDEPWWADAQEYRNRGARRTRSRAGDDATPPRTAAERAAARRRRLEDTSDLPAGTDPYGADAARRRRAAAARAAAQQRRARTRRSDEPVAYQWIDDSPFAPTDDEVARVDRRRDRDRRERSGAGRPGTAVERRGERRPGTTRRAGGRPAKRSRKRLVHPAARPERLLLYIAILGLFLVLVAATNSDAATVHHALTQTRP